jgi:hypothetical protein
MAGHEQRQQIRTGGVAARARAALGEALTRARPGVELDEHGYVVEVEDNLLPGVTRAEIQEAFGAGAGHELEGKMRAPWSSSALAVNSFAPWARGPLQLAGLTGFGGQLVFEAQCPNGVSTIPPHLDVLLEHDGGFVGVESKCTEHLSEKTAKVADAYLRLAETGDARASSRWFAALEQVPEFRLLDAYQLVKHFLGLSLTYQGRPLTLVYLYWEPANAAGIELFARHRAEVDRLASLVDGDETCRFSAISYPVHWAEPAAGGHQPEWLDHHLARLRQRYEVEI